MRRRLADLVRGEDEGLVLDRPRPQQHLPVVAAGGAREGRGDGEQAGAAHGEDPVELGEAQVVTDAEPDARARRPRAVTSSVAGLLVLGLAVGDAADVDVEHVDLAVDGEVLAVGADQDRGVEEPLAAAPRSAMLPASRWMPSSRAQPRAALEAGAVERLGAGEQLLAGGRAGSTSPAARPARRRRRRRRATRRSAAARFRALSSVELSCIAATRIGHLCRRSRSHRAAGSRLTDESI